MLVEIIIEKGDNENVEKLAEEIHHLLVGNTDYVDSNVVLNIDNSTCNTCSRNDSITCNTEVTLKPSIITLYINKEDCCDYDKIVPIIKQVVDKI